MRARNYLTICIFLISGTFCQANILTGQLPNSAHPDLMFWLKADEIAGLDNGDSVTSWADSSANELTFIGGLVAADTTAHSPTYISSGLNGLPAVNFDSAAKQWIAIQNSVIQADGPLTMIIVAENIDNSAIGTLVSFNRSDNGYHQSSLYSGPNNIIQTSSRTSKSGDGSNTNSSVSYTTTAVIATGQFDNGVSPDFGVHAAGVNGAITDAPAAARSASYDRISIGAMTRQAESNFHSFLDGEISEVLVYNRVLSPVELNALGYYLSQKYNIPATYNNEVMYDGAPNPIYTGLEVWLSADSLTGLYNGQPLDIWPDLSFNEHAFHGGCWGPQGDTHKPVYRTYQLNRLPVVRFSGDQWMMAVEDTQSLVGPLTMFVVAKGITNAVTEMDSIGTLVEMTTDDYGYARTSIKAGDNELQTHSRMGKYTHDIVEMEYDDWVVLAVATFAHDTSATPAYGPHQPYANGMPVGVPGLCNNSEYNVIALGAHAKQHLRYTEGTYDGYGEWLKGDIAEVLIYREYLDEQQILAVGDYLTRKYDLATTYVNPAGELTETDGNTVSFEQGETADVFSLSLNQPPASGCTVTVDVIPHHRVTDMMINSLLPGQADVLTFDATNWNVPQAVTVQACDDDIIESELYDFETTGVIKFHVQSTDSAFTDKGFRAVQVFLVDNDVRHWSMLPYDLNEDTYITLSDMALLADNWLTNYYTNDLLNFANEWLCSTNPLDENSILPLKHISQVGSGRATAYNNQNKIVTIGDKTHISWQDSHDNSFWTKITTYDRTTGTFSPTYTIGSGTDNHGGPMLIKDSQNYLHIFYYPHHEQVHYRRSLYPNDASVWTADTLIGDSTYHRLTYPVAVCTQDDNILLACRHRDDDEYWTLVLYEKPYGQSWQGPRIMVHGNASGGYTNWSQSLSVAPDGQTVHLSFGFYETDFPDPTYSNISYAVGYLYSPDQGQTWKRQSGQTVTLPATSYTVDLIAGSSWPTSTLSVGHSANTVAPEGTAWVLYCTDNQWPYEPHLVQLNNGQPWRRINLLPVIQAKWPNMSALWGNLAFDADGRLYVALTLMTTPTGRPWGHDRAEVVVMVSEDQGKNWRIYRISPWNIAVPNWHPSLERPTRGESMPIPSVMFTHGERGTENTQIMSNDVLWCDFESLLNCRQ